MHIIAPKWTAPQYVKAFTVAHPVDETLHAKKNFSNFKRHLQEHFQFQKEPAFLEQIHSNIVIDIDHNPIRTGDASITQSLHQPLVILTADCLPILVTHRFHQEIANIHAGWRGLFEGVIENTFSLLKDKPENYIAWIGPAICQNCYEVGEDFRQQFMRKDPSFADTFTKKQDWHFNLANAAELILKNLGVHEIHQSQLCTYEQQELFSYRREKENASRLGTIIWLED
jgi:YfiH family protein